MHRRPAPLTQAQRLQFALALTLIGLVALVATCGACVSESFPSRSAKARSDAAVFITAFCEDGRSWHGSGAIVSSTMVLTAFHVVNCQGPGNFTVDPGDGRKRVARVESALPQIDTARLIVDGDLSPWATKVVIGPRPQIGEEVCEATGWPRWTYRCGLIQPQREEGGQFRFEFMTEHGNSGAGIYDHNGRLVGVVSEWRSCEGGVDCGGTAYPLQGYEWLVPRPAEDVEE